MKRVLGDKLKYSYQFSDYYIWEEKRYRGYGDSNYLIHAITEILGLVEHSVFHWVATEVIPMEQSEEKEHLEERAEELFKASKSYVTTKLAKDVLLMFAEGLDIHAMSLIRFISVSPYHIAPLFFIFDFSPPCSYPIIQIQRARSPALRIC